MLVRWRNTWLLRRRPLIYPIHTAELRCRSSHRMTFSVSQKPMCWKRYASFRLLLLCRLVGEGDVGAQVRQAYKNIGAILADSGASFEDVVSINTYVVGRESVQPYLDARAVVFAEIFRGEQFPPNTFLIIDGLLHEDYLVEVTVTAALP